VGGPAVSEVGGDTSPVHKMGMLQSRFKKVDGFWPT
jgi:hypothetical protein